MPAPYTPDELARFCSEVAAAVRDTWPHLSSRALVTEYTFDGRRHQELEAHLHDGASTLTLRWEVNHFWIESGYRHAHLDATLRRVAATWPP